MKLERGKHGPTEQYPEKEEVRNRKVQPDRSVIRGGGQKKVETVLRGEGGQKKVSVAQLQDTVEHNYSKPA